MNDLGRFVFLTGKPGVGKTSVLLRAVKTLQVRGLKVRGMISREVREGTTRIGFRIIDLETEREGWLAHVNQKTGPHVGKYRVNLKDLRDIGIESILKAIDDADVIVIDEIGPMELHSSLFKDAVIRAIQSKKTIIGSVHFRVRDPLIYTIKTASNIDIFEVTCENRHRLHEVIVEKIMSERI